MLIHNTCIYIKKSRGLMLNHPWCHPVFRVLMRNLFLGYFHTPKPKRADVLRLMGGVLGLNREDIDKVTFSLFHPQTNNLNRPIPT